MKTLCPEVQEIILDALPSDGLLAIDVMCQLLAKMVTVVDNAPNLPRLFIKITEFHAAYERT